MTEHHRHWTVAFPQVFFWTASADRRLALPCHSCRSVHIYSVPLPLDHSSHFPLPTTDHRTGSIERRPVFPSIFLNKITSFPWLPTLWLPPPSFFQNYAYKRHHQTATRTPKKQAKHVTLPESQDLEIKLGIETIRTSYCDWTVSTSDSPIAKSILSHCVPALTLRQDQIDPIRCRITPPLFVQHSTAQHSTSQPTIDCPVNQTPYSVPSILLSTLSNRQEKSESLGSQKLKPTVFQQSQDRLSDDLQHAIPRCLVLTRSTDNPTLLQPWLGSFLTPMEARSDISRHFS